MRFLSYVQVYVIISFVRANCTDRTNQVDSDSGAETDCSCKVTEDTSSDCENNNKIDRPNIKATKITPKYPINSHHKKRFRHHTQTFKDHDQTVTSNLPPPMRELKSAFNETSREADSLDIEQTTTVTSAAKEYMEEFRKSVTHTSITFRTVSWTKPGNKSSEESDETKSTLVDYPFSVSIQRKGSHYASGALLDKLWVITVAGEFYNVRDSLKLFRARLGSVDCKRGGKVVPFKNIEFHPYYIPGKPNFDVAMLRMAYPAEYSDVIRPIAISTVKGKVLSAKFMSTYWPRILVKGSVLPKSANERIKYNSMRVSTQRLIPQDKCIKIIKSLNEVLNESTLCLKPVVSHHSVCMPDAGAPIVAEDGLWGITSGWISPTCPDTTAPTVFTRLSSPPVRSWLNTVLLNL